MDREDLTPQEGGWVSATITLVFSNLRSRSRGHKLTFLEMRLATLKADARRDVPLRSRGMYCFLLY